jgi:hypothetical protein
MKQCLKTANNHSISNILQFFCENALFLGEEEYGGICFQNEYEKQPWKSAGKTCRAAVKRFEKQDNDFPI